MKNIKIICCLLLVIFIPFMALASDQALPPLPTETIQPSSPQNPAEKSTFGKIKDFFNFKSKKQETIENEDMVVDIMPSEEIEKIGKTEMMDFNDDQSSMDQLNIPEGFLEEDGEEQIVDSKNINKNTSVNLNKDRLQIQNIEEDATIQSLNEDLTTQSKDILTKSSSTNTQPIQQVVNVKIVEKEAKPNNLAPSSSPKAVESSTSKVNKEDEMLVPNYDNNISNEANAEIDQYVNEYQQNLEKNQDFSKLEEGDIQNDERVPTPEEIRQRIAHKQFISNESQVLLLPDDDVVLGKVTKEAKIEQMDFRKYAELFWEEYNRLSRQPQREAIEQFIKNYDENFN